MARRVFFSFHFDRDNWRASQVRNSWLTKPDRQDAGFFDAAVWERVKKQNTESIKRWIREQMKGTSVTAVLIGAETFQRYFVLYEIQHSWDSNNGLLGVRIHGLRNRYGQTDLPGADPFEAAGFTNIRVFDWVGDHGYDNFGRWVEEAAQRVASRHRS